MRDLGIILCKQGLLLLVVIEAAVMGLRVAMLRAVDVAAFAWSLDKADFAIAFPALISVSLYFRFFLLHLFVLHF